MYVGIVNRHFSQIATELRPLIDVRNQFCSICRERIDLLIKIKSLDPLRANKTFIRKKLGPFETKFVYTLIFTRSTQICNRVTALD